MLETWVSASHQTDDKNNKNTGRQSFAIDLMYTSINVSLRNSMAIPEDRRRLASKKLTASEDFQLNQQSFKRAEMAVSLEQTTQNRSAVLFKVSQEVKAGGA